MSPTEYASPGFAITSAAPSSRPLRATSGPFFVRELTMITGMGWYFISFSRKLKPSILGISISRTSTSGFN